MKIFLKRPVENVLTLFFCLSLVVISGCVSFACAAIEELPGGPANSSASLSVGDARFRLEYDGKEIFTAEFSGHAKVTSTSTKGEVVEQKVRFVSNKESTVKVTISGGSEALAAETSGKAQKLFPIVRTTHGLSRNLRNNAVYDRNGDWMIEMPAGKTRIVPQFNADGTTKFDIEIKAASFEIIFRPRYYQKHKNIRYFQPWSYKIRKDSITGWNSWWAYMRDFRQEHLDGLLKVWQEKRFADYGYRFVQIDDVFQGGKDAGRRNSSMNRGYLGGRPETWLEWKKDRFSIGMTGYVDTVSKAGFEPGVWVGCFFSDEMTVEKNPEWFVKGTDGKAFAGPWISYAIDATIPEAAKNLVRPTYRGLRNAGFSFVKIDQLRHLLYDNLHRNPDYCKERGYGPDEIFRAYLRTARQELGDDVFILSCWGVLPESVGIADACRIGGDGYGPVTMQQYNSWNGIVWRNDPDHCDVYPRYKPAEIGNVKKTEKVKPANNDTIIRPALASIAGCMLMLSDKPEVYKDDRNLVGAKRSSPVLFSVPGQLYDFDSSKTDKLSSMKRTDITTGAGPSPIDGNQHGEICPWWLNEINLDFGYWNVLHRLNWSRYSAETAVIKFSEIGLDPEKEYIVFEFWSDKLIGVASGSITLPAIEAMGLHSFAIREKIDRPQLVSTNRHLSQGAVDIETMSWFDESTLAGRSRVVCDDRYVITLMVPDGHKIKKAVFDGKPAKISYDGSTTNISFLPKRTDSIGWEIEFEK